MPVRLTLSGLAMAFALVLGLSGYDDARAQPTDADSSSAQPQLPAPIGSIDTTTPGLSSGKAKPLTVRKRLARHTRHQSHRIVQAYHQPFERPALAGVELLEDLPHPLQPPGHIIVPLPAYPLENFAAFYTTPPPPVVCHPAPRDPDLPDPHLLYQRPVICEADNP